MGIFLDSRALQIITTEVQSKGLRPKPDATGISICCPLPNHDERTPSCHINLTAPTVPVGYVHCYGCNFKNHWNEFAKIIGWAKLPTDSAKEVARMAPNATVRFAHLKALMLSDTTNEPEWHTVEPWLKDRLPVEFAMDWREIPNSLLKKLGCKRVITRDGTPFIVIPVRLNKNLVGIVRGRWIKSADKDERSYFNSGGGWVKKRGLLGYDYIQKLPHWKKHKIIVLVEGPRDALKLLAMGIPALSILGNNWSLEKLQYLLDLNPNCIASLMDNDKAGRKLARAIRDDCASRHIHHVRVKLPPIEKVGKKIDPAVLSPKQIDKVMAYIMKKAA